MSGDYYLILKSYSLSFINEAKRGTEADLSIGGAERSPSGWSSSEAPPVEKSCSASRALFFS